MIEKDKERLLFLAIKALDSWESGEMVSAGYYLSNSDEAELDELIQRYKKGDD